jgi:SNF2 family DNA or RNA helicase
MSTGLTLTESYRVARLDMAWTPAENRQAEDRVCRIGQTRGVEIIDFVAENVTLDDRVYRLLKAKERIINDSIEVARVAG